MRFIFGSTMAKEVIDKELDAEAMSYNRESHKLFCDLLVRSGKLKSEDTQKVNSTGTQQ